MKFRLANPTESVAGASAFYSTPLQIGGMGGDSYSVQAVIDVNTPAAVIVASAAITFATATWHSVAHGFTVGLKVQLTTSSALPTGLALLTDYFVIVVDANNFKLASSLVLAQAGTAVVLSDAGVGNQTVTPVALAGGTIGLQQSNNYNPITLAGDWAALGSTTNVTADAVVPLEKDRPTFNWVRVSFQLTAGHISAILYQLVKGDLD